MSGKRDLTNPPNPHTLPDTHGLPANRNPDAEIDGRDTSASPRGFAKLVERVAGGVVGLVRRAPGGPSPELTSAYTGDAGDAADEAAEAAGDAAVPSPEMLSDDEGAGAVGDDVRKNEGHEERDGNSRNWRVRKMAIEFNSGAWVRNLGGTCAV